MKTFALLLACVLSAVSLCAAELPHFEGRGDWGKETLGVRCRITTDKARFAIGDAVRVLVEVRNTTEKPVVIGLEPLIEVDKDGRMFRQPAELLVTFSQGSPGFFCTYRLSFPHGKKSETKAVVIQPKTTFPEVVTVTPWGPTYSSIPSTAQPGKMNVTASLWQFLSPDLKKKKVEPRPVVIFVEAAKKGLGKDASP